MNRIKCEELLWFSSFRRFLNWTGERRSNSSQWFRFGFAFILFILSILSKKSGISLSLVQHGKFFWQDERGCGDSRARFFNNLANRLAGCEPVIECVRLRNWRPADAISPNAKVSMQSRIFYCKEASLGCLSSSKTQDSYFWEQP